MLRFGRCVANCEHWGQGSGDGVDSGIERRGHVRRVRDGSQRRRGRHGEVGLATILVPNGEAEVLESCALAGLFIDCTAIIEES